MDTLRCRSIMGISMVTTIMNLSRMNGEPYLESMVHHFFASIARQGWIKVKPTIYNDRERE